MLSNLNRRLKKVFCCEHHHMHYILKTFSEFQTLFIAKIEAFLLGDVSWRRRVRRQRWRGGRRRKRRCRRRCSGSWSCSTSCRKSQRRSAKKLSSENFFKIFKIYHLKSTLMRPINIGSNKILKLIRGNSFCTAYNLNYIINQSPFFRSQVPELKEVTLLPVIYKHP